MTSITIALIPSNVTSELYNITVTCAIHPDSTADQCVVMAMDDGRATITGIMASMVRTYVYRHINNMYV